MEEADERIVKKAKKEELQAVGQYDMHLLRAKDKELIKILEHNKKDELEDHARKLGWYIKKKERIEATG